jgi:hypothetical protein
MRALVLLVAFATFTLGCNDRRDMAPRRDAGGSSDASRLDASGGDGGGSDSGSTADTGTVEELEYNAEGCLTFAGASALCGFESDGSICEFALECGLSESTSQCSINCEMGATVSCYTRETVACLRSAASTFNCGAASECGFIL